MKTLWNWLAARKAARKVVDSIHSDIAPAMVETLEDRCFLSVAAPHVVSVYADNRGLMQIKLDQKLNPASVSKKSVKVWKATAGADQAITNPVVGYSATKRTITVKAGTSANAIYKVRLISKLIKNTTGVKLDGEFKPVGKSGNGRPGGDWFGMSAAPSENIARFTTTYGIIDVQLFTQQTPLTVTNFLNYSNAGDWDGTVFHRSAKLENGDDFVIQGGGFQIDSLNRYTPVHDNPPSITNEPHPGAPGNIYGTIAMARSTGVNSATDQWYFNVNDNRTILDNQNGGFTVFGKIINQAGEKVMQKIADATVGSASGATSFFNPTSIAGAFGEVPVTKTIAQIQAEGFSPQKHSIIVTRIAINQAVVKGVRV